MKRMIKLTQHNGDPTWIRLSAIQLVVTDKDGDTGVMVAGIKNTAWVKEPAEAIIALIEEGGDDWGEDPGPR